MHSTSKAAQILSAALALALASPALAQQKAVTAPSSPTEPERPWAKGVTPEVQQKALALFRDGNSALKESLFVKAATSYRDALKIWDHPAIHYNLVLALLNLDQPIEVHEHLEAAMKYGAAPLDNEKFEQAKAYKALVERQLARVDIKCDVEGASVKIDGRQVFVGPGQYQGLLRAGPHTILATKEGFITNEQSPSLPPGETTSFELKLFSANDLTKYKRRWATWVPWSVVGAGAVVGLAGGGLHFGAKTTYEQFDQGVVDCGGCPVQNRPDLEGKRSTGDTFQTLAIGGYALGGAALATGAVLLYMNRLQPYQVNEKGEVIEQNEVSVAPLIGGDAHGIQAALKF